MYPSYTSRPPVLYDMAQLNPKIEHLKHHNPPKIHVLKKYIHFIPVFCCQLPQWGMEPEKNKSGFDDGVHLEGLCVQVSKYKVKCI